MTTPKRNEAVAPCAWIVSNGSQCCEPWVVFEKSEVDAMPSACIAGAVYSQQTIDALQGEVSRLRAALDEAAVALSWAGYALAEFEGFEKRTEDAMQKAYAASQKAHDANGYTNLEPPTDGQ